MKKKLLLFMALICFIAGNAQINPTREEHYEVPCEQEITNPGCNMILNPAFQSTGDHLEDFSDGEVVMWQDINNLTSDINGALAESNGWALPAVPVILTGTNYASMLVDNLNLETEGISGRTFPLLNENKYAFSFFLSSSKLSNYRNLEGTYTLKIYLTNCQSFSTNESGNPEITGEKQLIYCREFVSMGDKEWHQYLVSFTADNDYNMIVIIPEISDQYYDGGTYLHFLYPELIPINPISQYQTYEIPGWTDYSDPQNPVAYPAIIEGNTLLSACGVTNASYQWEGPTGIVSNQVSSLLGPNSGLDENSEFTFTMSVEGAMGNNPYECMDDEPPVIIENAEMLETTTGTQIANLVNCNDCISTGTCNMIPNPVFLHTVPTPLPFPGYNGHHAFSYGYVHDWTAISYGTPDIGGSFIPVPTLPPAISNLGIPVNSAGLALENPIWYEGITAKTEQIHAGRKYMFSFFVSSIYCCAQYNLKVILANCQEFPVIWPNFPPWPPMPPLNIVGHQQNIFCQISPAASGPTWTQYVVSFIAEKDFDMLVIYPELLTPAPNPNSTYLQILYPELIDVDNLISITNNSSGDIILKACGVANATYEWFDDNNVSVGTTSEMVIDPALNPEDYSVTVCVPNILNNPLLNNSCGTNIGCISGIAVVSTIWTGITSEDWNTASNWNTATVPNSYTKDVYIPSGTPRSPEIVYQTPTPYEFQVNNITIAPGATLINNGLLKVAGKIYAPRASIDNYYIHPITSERIITGSIEMNGTCEPQTIGGNVFVTNDVKNFTASNNVTVSSATTKGLDVHGQLAFGTATNKTLFTGDNLTMVSNATTTANVAQIDPSNFIDGEVTVERHILTGTGSGEHAPKWQALATPTGANSIGQSVYNSWMEGGNNTSTGYGTHIPDPTGTTNGFDYNAATQTTPSIKTYNYVSNGFDPIANTSIPLHNKNGYFLFVRGDRSKTLLGGTPNPTNMRSKGALFQPHTGYTPQSVTVAGGQKFELVGNPYASAIDIDYMRTQGKFSNLTNHVTVWDPLIPGTLGLGGYQVLSAPNYTPTPGGTLGNTHHVTGVPCTEIQSGQAFFMQTSGSSTGTITFDETVKSSNSRVVTRMNNATGFKSFRANLFSGTGICDGNAIIYDNMFKNDIDANDAGRPLNPGENFMIRKENNAFLTVEARDIIKHADSIFYIFKNLRKIKYQLVFAAENLQQEGLRATLIDNYLQKKIPLSLTDSSFVDFMVDDNKASYENRFMVVFNQYTKAVPLVADKNKQLVDRSFVVYPNPTENKTISIQYANQPTGMYKLQLINYAGQVVINSNIKITDTNGRASVKPGSIAAGSYQLVITAADGRKSVLHVVIK